MASSPHQTCDFRIRRFCAAVSVALLMGGSQGCATRGNIDLLESRLRMQEDSMHQMEANLARAKSDLAAAKMESEQLRAELNSQGKKTLLAEQADVLYRTAEIQIDRFRSGGLDDDGNPGDEVLTAAIVPKDRDGELVKLAGAIELELVDLAKPNGQQSIGKWSFDANQTSEYWIKGFLGSGYFFKLPMKQLPEHNQLVLRAKLTAPDGRHFDASETIRFNLPAALEEDTSRIVNSEPQDRKPSRPAPLPLDQPATRTASASQKFQGEQKSATTNDGLAAPAIQETPATFPETKSAARKLVAPVEGMSPGESAFDPEIEQLNFSNAANPPVAQPSKRFELLPGDAGDQKPLPGSGGGPVGNRPVSGSPVMGSSDSVPEWARDSADVLLPVPPPRGSSAKNSESRSGTSGSDFGKLSGSELPWKLEPATPGDRKARAEQVTPDWSR